MNVPRHQTALLFVAVAVLIACLSVMAVVLWQLKPAPSAQQALTAEDARRLIQHVNLGLGHLENHDTANSIPVFTEVAARLPDEPLGPRNAAVAGVLALGEDFEHVTPDRIAAATEALALVRKTEGETPAWHWLSARTALAAQNFKGAIAHLSNILDSDRRNASAWYELYLAHRSADETDSAVQAWRALDRAFELRPGNLFVLVEYLRQLEEHAAERQRQVDGLPADRQAAARRSAIAGLGDVAARLAQARQTLAPFQDRLQAIHQVDVLGLMDEAIEASQDVDLKLLAERAGQVARLVLGMAAQDLRQIRPHVLEFVLSHLRPEFYEEYGLLEPEPTPAIKMSFDAGAGWQFSPEQQQQRAEVESVELADFDLDGRTDLIILDATGLHVFRRTESNWELVSETSVAAGMHGLLIADLDLDFDEFVNRPQGADSKSRNQNPPATSPVNRLQGSAAKGAEPCPAADPDVVVYGPQGVAVLRNRYTADRDERSLERIEQPIDRQKGVTAATAADLDGDGDLDLIIAAQSGVQVWSNRGNATFEDISSRSSLPSIESPINGLVAIDWDRDVDVDVLVSGEQAGFLENLRHGQMRWQPFDGDFQALASARAIEPVDADANGSWDLVSASREGLRIVSTTTITSGVVRVHDNREISEQPARDIRSLDYDNDGHLDLLTWDDTGPAMYRGLPDGRFQPVDLLPRGQAVRDCRPGDLDGDGDLDLVLADDAGVIIALNNGGNQNHWLDVALVAQQMKGAEASASGRVNAHGLGSLLELKSAAYYQPAVVRGQTTHFGLGRRVPDVVRVAWLNGVPQNILQPPARQTICEQQLLTGSCPYLYSWNGTAFEFVTDLLWASPLGLQAADGVLLPWREWEYLKIPGDKLARRGGDYIVQVTEELWEAAYFDEVKLIAIDHPANVDIYSNEKVGPPDIAAFKIHTAREKRHAATAVNHRGRDLTREMAAEDGVYARPFDEKLRQGLVEEHFIELDLGDLTTATGAQAGDARRVPASPIASPRVTLFLTGWIYPSGTSLNVAISQNPDLPKSKPPALLVPDGAGGWREALPFMGFPGGKTKTIAVDLAGVLTEGDSRLRIATNLELYWDQIFFTVNEPAAEVRQTTLELRNADLHYRGFSRIEHNSRNAPEQFLYAEPSTASKWPPMQGRFTRYGDVAELLRDRDDRLVVLGAGDEMTLRFKAPKSDPPPGWKRDFIIHSVGWDKDANLCTIVGDTSEPLPFGAMLHYPPHGDDRPPNTAEYRRYLREYQTRTQGDEYWRLIRQKTTSHDVSPAGKNGSPSENSLTTIGDLR